MQKCVRTLDIDEVGKTTRHASFFQMAGNFSFGDYFKEGAIPFAWELLTRPQSDGGFGFAEDKLWATVYDDDDEALDIWHRVVGLPLDRIQRRRRQGQLLVDGRARSRAAPARRSTTTAAPSTASTAAPSADEDRYLEVWNLVFMQDELSAVRSKLDFDIRGDLPAQNIDTGMGLERMAALLQGVDNIYEIDVMRAILDRASELTGARYGADHRRRRAPARGGRPRAHLRVPHAGRRAARQRGPRLRAAPHPAPRRPQHAPARRERRRSWASSSTASVAAMGPQYPELRRRRRSPAQPSR